MSPSAQQFRSKLQYVIFDEMHRIADMGEGKGNSLYFHRYELMIEIKRYDRDSVGAMPSFSRLSDYRIVSDN